MNVLVTGAGMVAAWAARAVRERGDSVVFADRAPSGAALREIVGEASVERIDVLDRDQLRRVMKQHHVEAVLHTAALLPSPDVAPRDLVEVNVVGTTNVLEAAHEHGVKRVVHVSSTVVYYGAFAAAPAGPVSESAPLLGVPGFFYGTSKIAAELVAADFLVTGLVDLVICRLGHVWGFWPGPPRSPIAALLSIVLPRVLAGETAVVSDARLHWGGHEAFVHVENAAAALAAALHAEAPGERILNVVDERPYAFEDFLEALARIVPGARVDRDGPPAGGYAGMPAPPPGPLTIERARAALGWSPAVDLESGLRALVAAHRQGSGRS